MYASDLLTECPSLGCRGGSHLNPGTGLPLDNGLLWPTQDARASVREAGEVRKPSLLLAAVPRPPQALLPRCDRQLRCCKGNPDVSWASSLTEAAYPPAFPLRYKAGMTAPASHCRGPCQAHNKCSVNVLRFGLFFINC